jgi:tetratricopeptide (TPR) repeat protein
MVLRISLLATVVTLSVITCSAQFSSTTQMTGDLNNGVPNNARITTQIDGNVSSASGSPVSGARIELRNTDNGSIVATTYSNQIGQFTIQNVELGRYEVIAFNGVLETRENLYVQHSDVPVSLRLPPAAGQTGQQSGATVSVSQYLVPEKARKELERAKKAFDDGKHDEARRHSEKALEIQPKYAEALTLIGVLDLSENQLDSAIDKLQAAIDADPGFPMAYVVMGAALNQSHKFQQALATLERGAAINPNSWQAHFEMAKADLGLADFDAALKSARRAAALNDKFPAIQLTQAHALLGLKRYSEAVPLYERYLSSVPSGPDSEIAQKALERARSNTGISAEK